MIEISGYQILGQIYQSVSSRVYRARREEDDLPVILKVLDQTVAPKYLPRYKQEYQIICSLDIEGAVKAYSFQKHKNNLWVMALEDFGGESLDRLIDRQKLSLAEFLSMAINIAEIIGEIHAANIIHKDINPSNIAVNSETGQVKLIDFGIASIFSRESQALKNPSVLEGTLAYMSPEQTGRMNRPLDYRTDFYSLGVTFYEMLAQQLPFGNTEDPIELVHCHIAKQPPSLHEVNPEIPKPLADIIVKMLAKNAEDRYQSAWGIEADLVLGMMQFEANGEIEEIIPGDNDVSDKFQIPQKLYGREKEVEALLAAFDRVSNGRSEIMLVSGYSGIGKSALVREIYKPVTRQRGYFISGKFDKLQRNIPYSALVSAFSDLVRQLLTESEEQLNDWREKLRAALGSNGRAIVEMIPEVELIIGAQPEIPRLASAHGQKRFNSVLQKFIGVFCQKEHPLVIFLDYLQWADSASLKLIELIMTDKQSQYLFLIGAYRDNEVSSSHPLLGTFEALRCDNSDNAIDRYGAACYSVPISRIALAPLTLEDISQLVADTLRAELKEVEPLAKLVQRKTQGNPFFVNEFLKNLYQENLLGFNFEYLVWEWDFKKIEALDITDNVVELMSEKLKKLPETTQDVLRLAACAGNEFDLSSLSSMYEQSPGYTFQALLPAIEWGLILPSDMGVAEEDLDVAALTPLSYKFLHDRVQEAAAESMDEEHKKAVRLQIGRRSLLVTPEPERSDKLFEIADNLNVGRDLISEDAEKVQLAQLNLEAGKRAKSAGAYASALKYLTAGMDTLPDRSWSQYYDLTLALYKERADAEYLNGNDRESADLIARGEAAAIEPLDKAEFYNLAIAQYTSQGQYPAAIEAGRKALKLLGIDWQALDAELAEAKQNLGDKTIDSLLYEEEMAVPEQRLAVKLIANLQLAAQFYDPELFNVLGLKITNLSLKYGHAPESPKGYSTYGTILVSILGDYSLGYEFARLGVKLSDRFNDGAQKCKASYLLGNLVIPWVKPLAEVDPIFQEGYRAGLESGELQYAGYIRAYQLVMRFYRGENLEDIWAEIPKSLEFANQTKNQFAQFTIWGLKLILGNLSGLTAGQWEFDSKEGSETQYLKTCQSNRSFLAISTYKILKTKILYLYGRHLEALQEARAASDSASLLGAAAPAGTLHNSSSRDFASSFGAAAPVRRESDYTKPVGAPARSDRFSLIRGHISVAEHNFYTCLTLAALYPEATAAEQRQYWSELEANRENLQLWAENCQANFQHKYLLVAAEMSRISGKDFEAIELYNRAIKSAHQGKFVHAVALGHELAAAFWLGKGQQHYAQLDLREARDGYELWGATWKVRDLEERYPQWLTATSVPASQDNSQTLGFRGILPGSLPSIPKPKTIDKSSRELDLDTVMKATRMISSEIVLEKLLLNLMNITIENAGAQKGFLILNRKGCLSIAAKAGIDSESLAIQEAIPIDACDDLPLTVIKYVERTRADVVLERAATEGRFINDPYIASLQLQSVLCSAIVNQGNLLGILYLENNLTPGAFTSDRLEFLRILSCQAGISLENALLYESLEEKVAERTREINEKNNRLEQTLQKLQQTQSQLIHTEKMSGLGQMVAGMAHELNNPVNFIYGNVEYARDYMQDIFDTIEIYQQEYPEQTPAIAEKMATMDWEFMLGDLDKLLNSMKAGSERIRNIVLSLRNFSRLDESDMKPVDIHEGIENTLLILQHRLKKQGQRPGIATIKQFGKLPKVTCYASQLNQVFMNVLNNAIDALSEKDWESELKDNTVNESFIANTLHSPNPELNPTSDDLVRVRGLGFLTPTITISTELTDSQFVTIHIIDNGSGMFEDIRKKIFDPFFTTKPVGKGIGLGLSISYSIVVEKHGGRLDCVSLPDRGTEFRVQIPLEPLTKI